MKNLVTFTLLILLFSANTNAQVFGVATPNNKDNNWKNFLEKKNSSETDEWIPLPIFAGEVTSIVRDQNNCNIAYAGTRDAGVFRTLDGGISWQTARDGLTFWPIRKLVIDPIDPATVYAGSDFDGIWKSVDSCKTWTQTGFSGGMVVFNILIDPTNNSIIYAGEAGGIGLGIGHLYKSVNAGESWSLIEEGLPELDDYTNGVFSLVMDPSNPQTLYMGTNFTGVFKSTNGGETWIPFSDGVPGDVDFLNSANALAISQEHTDRPSALFNGNLYKHSGSKWEMISDGYIGETIGPGDLLFYPNDSTRLFTNTYFSEDAGTNWQQYNDIETESRIGFTSISGHTSGCNKVYGAVGGYNGTAISTDYGKSWSKSSQGIMATTAYSVAIDHANPMNIYTGTTENFHFSHDGGETWQLAYTVTEYEGGYADTSYSYAYVSDIQIDPNNSDVVYITTVMDVQRSDDGGQTFQPLADAGSPSFVKMHKDAKSGAVYSAGRGVQRSFDQGETWEPLNSGLPTMLGDPVDIQCFALDPSDTSKMWVGMWWYEGLYKTENGGETWTLAGITDESIVSAVAVHPENSEIIFAGAGFGEGKILKSTDGGQTWQTKHEGIALPMEFVFDPRGANQIYVATEGWGILRSTDGGETWHEYDNGVFYPVLYSIDISPDSNPILVAGTYGSGAYRLSPPYIEPQSVESIYNKSNWNIFPNPSNGVFSLVHSSTNNFPNEINISVYSITGSVTDMFTKQAIGNIDVDLRNHLPGVYFLRITVGNFSETKKIVIQ